MLEDVVHLARESGLRHNHTIIQLVKRKRSSVESPCPVGKDCIFNSRLALWDITKCLLACSNVEKKS